MTATNASLYFVSLPHEKSTKKNISLYCPATVCVYPCRSLRVHVVRVPVEARGQSWLLFLRN